MIKNTLPNIPGNSENLKKQSSQFETSSTNVYIVGDDVLRALYKLVCLRVSVSSDQ